MEEPKTSHRRALVAALISLLWLLPSVGKAQTSISCGSPGALQAAIDAAAPGATLLVSGTCNENVVIGEDKSDITLDGQGSAIVDGGPAATATSATIQVRGRGIVIKGFTTPGAITGGRHGVQVLRGGTALIDGNKIQSTGGNGIFVTQGSSARIINNTIENNLSGDGIQVGENSSARIGILAGSDTTASPNTIQGNGGRGITVSRYSNARIVGNTIANNFSDGVRVVRVSHAEISDNEIRGNGGDGIEVGQNSGVNLGNDTGTGIFDLPNDTTANNSGSGIRCFTNSYADGRLGTLNGNSGPINFSGSCINSLLLADLAVTKVDSPDPVAVGSNLTYTITVTNNGPATATGVTLTDTLPANVTFISATSTQGTCTGTSTVTCNIGTLGANASRTVTIVVTPAIAGGISNTATVTANEPDINTANNTAAAVTTVTVPNQAPVASNERYNNEVWK